MAETTFCSGDIKSYPRGYHPGTRAPDEPGLYGLADKRFARYGHGIWYRPNHEPDLAMNETLIASTSSPAFRTLDVHYWCKVPDVVESIRLLNNYYLNALIEEGELLSSGWQVNTNADDIEFVRHLGGSGTPFVTYEFTVRQNTPDPGWIPMHGCIAKKPLSSPAEAGNFLMAFWHSLSLRDRLASHRYQELVAF